MKIHEYQAKEIIAQYGVKIPQGKVVTTVDEAVKAVQNFPTNSVVIKAQIHAGGRGKGGGVLVSQGIEEVKTNAGHILGMQLITPQTGAAGQKVKTLLIEECLAIKKELYCSILIDRALQRPVLLASIEGGMEIEEVADQMPEKILKEVINPSLGLCSFQAQRMAFRLGLHSFDSKLVHKAANFFIQLYRAFIEEDFSLLEINPLVITMDHEIFALDCKVGIDDAALFRHLPTQQLRDLDEENENEIEASQYNLNFIQLDGEIGCMVNGAGLAMATMDIIQYFGSSPANFLDVGGNATQERVEAAFRLITKDPKVKCILINIFGGIVQCDMIAKGIVAAIKNIKLLIPIVLRLEGSKAEEAAKIIAASNLENKLFMVQGLATAAQKAVTLVN